MTATPIRDGNGQTVGVLSCAMDSGALNKMIGEIKEGVKGYAFMLGKSGTIIAHTDLNLVETQENIIKKAESDSSLKDFAKLPDFL